MARAILLSETPVNNAPIVSDIPNQTISEGSDFMDINLNDYVDDPDNTDSDITWIFTGNKDLSVTIDDNQIVTVGIPDENWYGSDTITFTATDPGQLADSDMAIFTVKNVNDPPKFVNLPDTISFMNKSDTTIFMGGFIEDVDSPISTLTWDFSANSSILIYEFIRENQELHFFTNSTPGMVILDVTVTDDSLASCTDSILIIIISELTGVDDLVLAGIPNDYCLYQNYPNPFNPSTKIKFALPKTEKVRIEVCNIIGQKIKTLLNKSMPTGYHEVEFKGENLPSGIYLYRIEAGEFQDVKKMILIR
jgi:hypothetical protein